MEKLHKTGEVLARTGLRREMLYRYLTIGLVKPARSTAGGQNLFDDSVFKHIELIKRLNASGYTLRDIKDTYFKDERIGPPPEGKKKA